MHTPTKRSPPKTVAAKEVVKALTEESGETIYVLRNATIKGKLDLRHRIINIAVDMQGCDFINDVDVGYAEFKQSVDFSRCHFQKDFDSGNKAGSHAIYRKDIKLNRAIFDARASFNGIRCEGSAFLHQAQFKSAQHEIDFSRAFFAKSFELNGAVFVGGATFYSLRCELVGILNECRFENDVRVIDFSSSFFGTALDCAEAIFKGGANFDSIKCGRALFDNAHFENEEQLIDFLNGSFDGELACVDAVFKGGASFDSVKSGRGFFNRCHFENQKEVVNFAYSSFDRGLECIEAVFKGGADFDSLKCANANFDKTHFQNAKQKIDFLSASFEGELTFVDAVFSGGASFDGIKCASGNFERAHFENAEQKIDFLNACAAGELTFIDAVFSGGASFDSIKCRSCFLNGCHFENDKEVIDFIYASFDVLEHFNVVVKGGARFEGMKCGHGLFSDTHFENKEHTIDFNSASFESLYCDRTVFEGEANFNGVTCTTTASFQAAEFRNSFAEAVPANGERKIDFAYASFGVKLDLTDARFNGKANLDSVVSGTLILAGANFQSDAVLSNMSMKRLVLGHKIPFADHSLDLRECTFDLFEGPPLWKRLNEKQNPKVYSRDPYLQFEKYYQRIGDEVTASEVYYRGCSDLRENSKREGGNVQWSSAKNVRDWLLKWLTGYGVKTWRLSIPIFFFVVLGTVIFWPDDALKLKPADKAKQTLTTQTAPPTSPTATSPDQPTPETRLSLSQKIFYRVGYSLDLFIPVVDLQLTDKWQPRPLWREIYSFVHILVGWLLIPLLVASLSGIVRKK